MEEIWKDIVGYEGYYQVSNKGRIKSIERKIARNDGKFNYIKSKILRCKKVGSDYLGVILCKNGEKLTKTIHRLVAEAFIPNPKDKPDVNHKDGIKRNNAVSNLEWVTKKENSRHAFINKLNVPPIPGKGRENKKSRPVIQKTIDNNIVCRFESITYASQKTGIYASGIVRNCLGKLKSAGGFRWKYAE